MESKAPVPQFIKDTYVRVPLPFAYLIACLENAGEKRVGNGFHSAEVVYSLNEIDNILKDDAVIQDLHRTPWTLGNSSKNQVFTSPKTMQETAYREGLHLTTAETKALYAFTNSAKDEASGTWIQAQGGLFDMPLRSIPRWTEIINFIPLGDSRKRQIIRGHDNKLAILFNVNFNRVLLPNSEVEKHAQSLLFYSNQYTVSQQEENFTCTRLNGPTDNTLFIEPAFFRNHFMPAARKKLEEVNLAANLDQDLKSSLLFFIPLLSDDDFAQAFFEKLNHSTVQPETMAFLLEHTKLCFGNYPIISKQPTFWQQHQSKIGGTAIGLMVVAAIIIPVILVFGWPVVVGAVGGAFVFGLIIALAGGISAAIGESIGSNIDDKRMMLYDGIEQMKAIRLGYANDPKNHFIVEEEEIKKNEEVFLSQDDSLSLSLDETTGKKTPPLKLEPEDDDLSSSSDSTSLLYEINKDVPPDGEFYQSPVSQPRLINGQENSVVEEPKHNQEISPNPEKTESGALKPNP